MTPFITSRGPHFVGLYLYFGSTPRAPGCGRLVGFSGTPNNGTPWAPYYSHTTPAKIPKDMGIVWEAYHTGVPLLGVPGITLECLLVANHEGLGLGFVPKQMFQIQIPKKLPWMMILFWSATKPTPAAEDGGGPRTSYLPELEQRIEILQG